MANGSRNFPIEQATPLPVASPSPRELRAQAVQRLQVGLFGLTLMLLLEGLANIIMQHARMGDAAQAASHVTSSGGSGNGDPLADIGVMPSPDGVPVVAQHANSGQGRSH